MVNGGGDSFWHWLDFQLWTAVDLDFDLGSGHTAYHRALLIDLYLYAKMSFGHLRPALLGRLCRKIDLKINTILIQWVKVLRPTQHKSMPFWQTCNDSSVCWVRVHYWVRVWIRDWAMLTQQQVQRLMCYEVHDHVASFIIVYILLHFRNTSDESVLCDSLNIFRCRRMPPWLNTC